MSDPRIGVLALQGKLVATDYQVSLGQRYSSLTYTPDLIGELMFNGVASDITRMEDQIDPGKRRMHRWTQQPMRVRNQTDHHSIRAVIHSLYYLSDVLVTTLPSTCRAITGPASIGDRPPSSCLAVSRPRMVYAVSVPSGS